MRRIYRFQRDTFVQLDPKKQHKKCAEFLRHILKEDPALLDHYNQLASWMGMEALEQSQSTLLDRYHYHLCHAQTHIKEHDFIVTSQDREGGAAFLPVTIYLDRLRSAHNIGSILRTCEAFRLGQVVYSDAMADRSHPQVAKASMGALDWVDYTKKPLNECPRPLIALETVPTAIPYYDFAFPETFTLALGNEEYGLSDELLASADSIIAVPLYGRKNSLNVAACFAILAAEIAKQHRARLH